jgi:hypothetical protein
MLTIPHPDTFWLHVTNIGLGVVTLIFCVAVAASTVREILERLRVPRIHRAPANPQAWLTPDLGITMADGGEPLDTPRVWPRDGHGLAKVSTASRVPQTEPNVILSND